MGLEVAKANECLNCEAWSKFNVQISINKPETKLRLRQNVVRQVLGKLFICENNKSKSLDLLFPLFSIVSL